MLGDAGKFSKDQSICGVGNGGKDACEGDSGGPLVVNVEVRDSEYRYRTVW